MSSKPIWFAVPEKSTDIAVPEKDTPNGTNGQKLSAPPVALPTLLGVTGRFSVANTVPVSFSPLYTVTIPGSFIAITSVEIGPRDLCFVI
jgi:hypothetical protein